MTELSVNLAGGMVYLAGLAKSHKEGIKKAEAALNSGAALEKFKDLVIHQGGDASVIDDYSLLPHTKSTFEVKALKTGFITKMDCKSLGMHCVRLGGGRQKTTDLIDFAVGFVMNKKLGDKVKKGETLVTIHCHELQMKMAHEIGEAMVKKDITIGAVKPRGKKKLIIDVQTKFAPKKNKR